MNVNFVVQFLVGLIGLGVAIDYSLLLITRWREELALGSDNHAGDRPGDGDGRARDRVQRRHRRAGPARPDRAADPVHPQHRHRRHADPADQRRRHADSGARDSGRDRAAAGVAAACGTRATPSRGWTAWARLVVRWRWLAAAAGLAVLLVLCRRGPRHARRRREHELAVADGVRPARASSCSSRPASRWECSPRSRCWRRPVRHPNRRHGADARAWHPGGSCAVRPCLAAQRDCAGRGAADGGWRWPGWPDDCGAVRDALARAAPAALVGGYSAGPGRSDPLAVRRLSLGARGPGADHVHPAGQSVPLAAAAAEGHRGEPAVCRRGLRRARTGLAGRLRLAADLGPAGHRRDHRLDSAVRLRLRVRPVDGLRGVHPQPDARGIRRHRRPPTRR